MKAIVIARKAMMYLLLFIFITYFLFLKVDNQFYA